MQSQIVPRLRTTCLVTCLAAIGCTAEPRVLPVSSTSTETAALETAEASPENTEQDVTDEKRVNPEDLALTETAAKVEQQVTATDKAQPIFRSVDRRQIFPLFIMMSVRWYMNVNLESA